MKNVVERFIQDYIREQYFFEQLARKCADQCENMLRAEGIRAIVTSRAKRSESLFAKLTARDEKKNYTNSDDIREDLVDLAGVRIAVYFPRDRERLSKIIGDYFDILKVKTFPIEDSEGESEEQEEIEPKEDNYYKVFSGYHAQHYLVQLRKESLPPESDTLCSGTVEIQAASVLMHAWSEVEHDLVYKPKSGRLSKNELSILDEVNGLVLSGEIALGRLQEAGEDRVRIQGRPFENQYELAIYLIDLHKRRFKTDEEPSVGSIELLMKFLEEAKGNKPEFVENLYQKYDPKSPTQTISECLINALKNENPDNFAKYAAKLGLTEATSQPPSREPNYRASFLIQASQIKSILIRRSVRLDKKSLADTGIDLSELRKIMVTFEKIRKKETVNADFKELAESSRTILKKLRTQRIRFRRVETVRPTDEKE